MTKDNSSKCNRLGACLLIAATLISLNKTTSSEPNNPFQRQGPEQTLTAGAHKAPIRGQLQAKTAHEWTEHFKCKQNSSESRTTNFRFPLSNLWYDLMSDCHREEYAWRFKYVDELKPAFTLHVRDGTVDERLSNIIYTISLNNMFDTNYFVFNSGDQVVDAQNELRVAGPEVDDDKCARELTTMSNLFDDLQYQLAQLRTADETVRANFSLEERHIRLARVLDSFGRYETGALDGKLSFAGAYGECVKSQLTLDQEGQKHIPMRYCWASMNSNKNLHPLLKQRKKFEYEADNPVLNVGACLPKSCHSKSFHRSDTKMLAQRLINSQLRLPTTIYVSETYDLESVFCLVDSDSDLGRIPTSGKLCLTFIAAWLVLCFVATTLNKYRGPTRQTDSTKEEMEAQQNATGTELRSSFGSRICEHLDISKSWREFTSDKRQTDPSTPVDLDVLNPIKLVACAFCVVAHTGLILGSLASETVQIAAYIDTSVLLLAALMTSVVIDTFFVISGMLMSYISLKKLARTRARNNRRSVVLYCEQNNKLATDNQTKSSLLGAVQLFIGQWLGITLNRYLRIVPFYALLFWFRRDVLNHLGEGPMWDYGLNRDTASGACTLEPWYTPFTFITAFKQLSKQCFVPSWSISNDIFFGIFIPPVILMFVRRPRLGIFSTITITVISVIAAMNAFSTLNMPDVWQYLDANMHGIALMFRSLTPLYSWPVYRASAFLVGTLAGYFLYDYERKQLDRINGGESTAANWPKWMTGPLTISCYVYILWHLLLSIFANDLKAPLWPYHRLFAFYFLNGDRLVWSITNAVIFLQMITIWRHNDIMQNFATQKWRTLAKLSFSVIFVHWILIVVYMGYLPAAPAFTLWHIFSAFSVILLASMAVGALLHVIFENPVDKLIKRELFGL